MQECCRAGALPGNAFTKMPMSSLPLLWLHCLQGRRHVCVRAAPAVRFLDGLRDCPMSTVPGVISSYSAHYFTHPRSYRCLQVFAACRLYLVGFYDIVGWTALAFNLLAALWPLRHTE